MQGGGSWSIKFKSPKGDSSNSVSIQCTSSMSFSPTSSGYFTLQISSFSLAITGSISMDIPQLTWKFDWWIVHVEIRVTVSGSISLTARFPYSSTRRLFGLPVYLDRVSVGVLIMLLMLMMLLMFTSQVLLLA